MINDPRKDKNISFEAQDLESATGSVGENIIGAPKMRNNHAI